MTKKASYRARVREVSPSKRAGKRVRNTIASDPHWLRVRLVERQIERQQETLKRQLINTIMYLAPHSDPKELATNSIQDLNSLAGVLAGDIK